MARWHTFLQARLLFAYAAMVFVFLGKTIPQGQPIDRAYHDTYYIEALHNYFLGIAALFGVFAIIYFLGFRLIRRRYSEWAAQVHFWGLLIGVITTLYPQIFLASIGMPRRYLGISDILTKMNMISSIGAIVATLSFIFFIGIVIYSLIRRA